MISAQHNYRIFNCTKKNSYEITIIGKPTLVGLWKYISYYFLNFGLKSDILNKLRILMKC